jgi:transposase
MFTIGGSSGKSYQIFLAAGVTDMRLSFNGLFAIIQNELKEKPLSGNIFVFCNRKRDRVKLFLFDSGGTWVCAKKLGENTFKWPDRADRKLEMTAEELQRLLAGMDLAKPRYKSYDERYPVTEHVNTQTKIPLSMPQPQITNAQITQQHV